MEGCDIIILGQVVLNILFVVIIILMRVRINMMSGEMNELKGRMEFSDNDINLLADALRDIRGTRF